MPAHRNWFADAKSIKEVDDMFPRVVAAVPEGVHPKQHLKTCKNDATTRVAQFRAAELTAELQ